MNRWYLFLMTIGTLLIMLSYAIEKPYTFIIMGVIIVIISIVLIMKDKNSK